MVLAVPGDEGTIIAEERQRKTMKDFIKNKKILDACCGSRMFYFNKKSPDVLYQDVRSETCVLYNGVSVEVKPEKIGDFRKMDFPDETFYLVIFDPHHLKWAGQKSWMKAKYGNLDPKTWKEDLRKGFIECWRVLRKNGTLIFKWSETQIKLSEIKDLFPCVPLLGNRSIKSKTFWIVFFKSEEDGFGSTGK